MLAKVIVFMIIAFLLIGIGYFVSRRKITSNSSDGSRISTTSIPVTVSSTTTTQVDRGPYGIGTRSYNLVEPGKSLCAPHGTTQGCVQRSMKLYVRYPIAGKVGQEIAGAAPYLAGGPYPLIVFGNGYLQTVANYSVILDYWVSKGYVVAAPQFPLSQTDSVGGPWEADVLNQPGDMAAALNYMTSKNQDSSSKMHDMIDASSVGFVGQSDGGDAALAAAYNSCCVISGIKAVISLSGAELTSYPGKYFTQPGVPLLVVQGTEDEINPPSASELLYDNAYNPKYYLSLEGADHLVAYQGQNSYSAVVQKVSTDFLNYYLKGKTASLNSMMADGNIAGVATIH